jgi:hypothetical protein
VDTNVDQIFLYGLDKEYRVVRYTHISNEHLKLKDLMFAALMLKHNYPNIELVYAADASYTTYRACQDSIKKGSVEERVLFKTVLDVEGLRMLI